jgi:aminoglycoside 6-adenylyltransferase
MDATLDLLVGWATREENIRAVVLTGSTARGATDAYSDLDIELYVVDAAPLLLHEDWYRQFGTVLVVEALENEDWYPSRLVYYAGGKIDFTIIPLSVLERAMEYDRPFQVVLDKDGRQNAFHAISAPSAVPPSEAEFLECVHWFYAAVIMWAKQRIRQDPFAATLRDRDSKDQLVRMVEWDHRARKGWDYDTWYRGVHLREWADPELLSAIEATWGSVDPEDARRAILASLDLFGLMSTRTARSLGYIPFDDSGVRAEVARLLRAAR